MVIVMGAYSFGYSGTYCNIKHKPIDSESISFVTTWPS